MDEYENYDAMLDRVRQVVERWDEEEASSDVSAEEQRTAVDDQTSDKGSDAGDQQHPG